MADFKGTIRRVRIREAVSSQLGSFRVVVVVLDDDEGQVGNVVVRFNQPIGGPEPIPKEMKIGLTKKVEEKNLSRYVFKELNFEGGKKPIEVAYSITAIMYNADGQVLGTPYTEDVIVEDRDIEDDSGGGDDGGDDNQDGNPFLGRIRRVRIRENANASDGSFRIIGVVLGDAVKKEVANLRVTFVQPIEGPKPTQEEYICKLVQVIEDKDKSRYIFRPLKFEKGAMPIEDSYNILATMLDANGRNLGEPFKATVIVEGKDSEEEDD